MERPVGATIIASLQFLGAALLIVLGLFWLLGMSFLGSFLGQLDQTRDFGGAIFTALAGLGALFAVVFFIFAVICMLLGWGMWTLKNWARMITMILCALGIFYRTVWMFWSMLHFHLFAVMFDVFRIVIYSLILWYLLQPDVKRAFV